MAAVITHVFLVKVNELKQGGQFSFQYWLGVCFKRCLHWLFFQAVAQNSELRERLCKIHAESHIVEPTLINLTAPVQVGAGMQWLYSLPPPTNMMIIIISIFFLLSFFFIPHGLEFATEWMSCPFPLLFQIQQMLHCSHPLTRLTLCYDDSDYYKKSTEVARKLSPPEK